VYDLIPRLFPEQYLADPRMRRDYDERLRALADYDALLAISRSTRDDLVRLAGVSPGRVFVIGSGADPSRFSPGEATTWVLEGLGVRKPFVLSVAATDQRKNSERVMEAIAHVPGPPPPQLVLCHHVTAAERALLTRMAVTHGIADRLVVTGGVDDDVLRELYRGCAVFALPSRYEGFGLPLLEAMLCGAPVVGGRNSSQPEVVGDAGFLVDPDSVSGLAELLQRLAFDPAVRSRSVTRGLLHAAGFRWDSCAARCEEALRLAVRRRRRRQSRPVPSRLRVALFSPLPPAPSGVADHAAELLERLQEVVDVDVFHGGGARPRAVRGNRRPGVYDERIFGMLDRARPYDTLLHEMGNSLHHDFVYSAALQHGGLVLLHEINLAGMHADLADAPGADPEHLEKEIAFDQPARRAELVRALPELARGPGGVGRALGERGAYLSRRLIQGAGRILVSDRLTLERLNEVYPEAGPKAAALPLGVTARSRAPWETASLRREHGIPEAAFVFGVFGIVSHSKYHLETVEAFRSVAQEDDSTLLLFVGRGPDTREARERAREDSLAGRVRFVEDPPANRFRDLMHAVDVGVNVRRPPTNWESSASLLQLLAAGTPTIVNPVDAFRGIPRGTVEWLEEDLEPAVAIEQAMRRLRGSAARRRELSEQARRHVSEHHDWALVTRACVEHLKALMAEGLFRRRVPGA
jgi:glycosyltransferase involved in cell wall biosynthesis